MALGDDPEDEPFSLIDPVEGSGAAANFLGMALCGLWFLRNGEILRLSMKHRWLSLAVGVPVFVALIALSILVEETAGVLVSRVSLGLGFPFAVGVAVPRLAGRLAR